MLQRALTTLAAAILVGLTNSAAWAQQDIRWGTPPVGTAGHKALVTLANLLNKEMPQYRISVLPTAGAIATVKGFTARKRGSTTIYYGSDVAFHELATIRAASKGSRNAFNAWPVQSFWSNTIEVGLAVHVRNKDKIRKWGDLAGKRVFTGPLPFDTRAQAERALSVLGVKFTYMQVDLSDRRIPAQNGRARRHGDLHRLGKLAAPLAFGGFARRRLGSAQPQPRGDYRAQGEGAGVSSR